MADAASALNAGFATIMAGARALQRNDDALLKAMTRVLDSLYAGYSNPPGKLHSLSCS